MKWILFIFIFSPYHGYATVNSLEFNTSIACEEVVISLQNKRELPYRERMFSDPVIVNKVDEQYFCIGVNDTQ